MEHDLAAQGMPIIPAEEVDAAAFRAAVQPCYEEMESYIGSDWIQQVKELVGMNN